MKTYENDNGVTYIYKYKNELTSYEKLLLKNQPEKYIRKNPEDVKPKKEKKSKEELLEKANAKLWKEVDKYEKNPKKYMKRMDKRDKILEKYFRKTKSKNKKHKMSKKEKMQRDNLIMYADMIILEREKAELGLSKEGRYANGSKMFMDNMRASDIVGYKHDNKKSILKALEDELLEKLNGDLFENERFVVEYHKKDKKKSKVKKKKNKQYDEDYVNNLIYI